jgi:3-methyladenine DNA glycosylase/8-oxoguanine DNA glycosylase
LASDSAAGPDQEGPDQKGPNQDGADRGTSRRIGWQGCLRYAEPLARGPLLRALAAHAVPGLEVSDPAAGKHIRIIKAPGGPALAAVSFGEPGFLVVRLSLAQSEDAAPVTTAIRNWLDLDADPGLIDAALGQSPLLRPFVQARPGLRVLGSVDGFETAVMTVLGQQVSLAAARTFGGRLVSGFGRPGPDGFTAFPEPEALAASTSVDLQAAVGLTHARSRTLHALSEAAADGLRLDAGAEPERMRRALLALPGIGPWTADYLAVRVLRDPDAYPVEDLVLKRALGVKTGRQAAALSEPWRPWRAYALTHLWTSDVFGVR